jgi:hypothetical protein
VSPPPPLKVMIEPGPFGKSRLMMPPPKAIAAIPPPPDAGVTVRLVPLRTLPVPDAESAGLPPDKVPLAAQVLPPVALAELLDVEQAACVTVA